MKISIITVCYNSEKHIKRCINSVRSQTKQIYEHIIVDGRSSDDTLRILTDYFDEDDGYLKKLISEKDDGVYDAMNKGLKIASGDYVWFLNSDDKLTDENVILYLQHSFSNKKPNMIVGATKIKNDKKVTRTYSPFKVSKWYIPQQPHPSILVDLNFLRTHKIFFDSSKIIASDYKMQLEVIKHKGVIFLCDRIFTDMYVGGISNSTFKYKILGWYESYQVYNDVFGRGGIKNTIYKILAKISQFKGKK
jgi:glycosyltransferase involved in cell wall biosynthesis